MDEGINLNIHLSSNATKLLKTITSGTGDDLSEILRKAISLYKVAYDLQKEGYFIGASKIKESLEHEFVGF